MAPPAPVASLTRRSRPGPGLAILLALGACSTPPSAAHRRLARAPIAVRLAQADAGHGATIFRQCAACHNIQAGGGDRDGPNLYGVAGHAVGRASPRFGYSGALGAVGGAWTADKLDRWLTSPQRFAPGTSMTFPGLPDGVDRADVIAYLNGQGGALVLPVATQGSGRR